MNTFSQNLRQRLNDLQMTQAELARRLSVSERRLGNYVTGIREPDIALLVRIADVLHVTVDELVRPSSQRQSAKMPLRDRLVVAAEALRNADLETLVVQAEALAAHRKPKA